jgi:hypothetical protein
MSGSWLKSSASAEAQQAAVVTYAWWSLVSLIGEPPDAAHREMFAEMFRDSLVGRCQEISRPAGLGEQQAGLFCRDQYVFHWSGARR